MTDFIHADLRGSRFRAVDLTDADFRGVDMTRVVMRGVDLHDVHITGDIENVTTNGVDIGPLVEAELNRRYPLRPKMRPTDPAGFRDAWDILERLWDETVEQAHFFLPQLLNESVNGEWAFMKNQKLLV